MKIALLPGGFKPPHLGHYNMAKYLADFADNVIVRIGQKEREGIGAPLALEVWNFYKEFDPDPRAKKLTISIAQSPSPVKDVYDFVENIAPEGSTVILGLGEKDASDGRYNSIPKFAEPRNIKADIKLVPPQAGGISGTRMREIIKANDKAEFFKYIPNYLPEEIKEEIWTKLVDTTMPADIEEMMGGTMNKQEMKKHLANMKKLRNFFAKQGDQMVPVPTKLTKGLRRKLYELKGRSYNQETLEISRIIINQFKANYGYEYDGYDEGRIGETSYELFYEFRPLPPEKMKGNLFDITGASTPDNNIELKIKYNKNIPINEILNDVIAELKETLRHEFQHIGQFSGYSDIPPNTKLDGEAYYKYLTDPSEVEAHLKGLYSKAKTQKLPLKQVIDNFLEDRIDDFNSPKEIDYVKKVWDRWIRINLPRIPMNEGIKDLRPKMQAIIKKHRISADQLKDQLKKGTKIEKEHTDNPRVAMKIALDHIEENPKYYDILAKAQLENFPPYKVNQVQQTRYKASDTFTNDREKAKKLGYIEESRLFSKEWWSTILTENLLNEGGAAGHMAHPFDLPNVNTGKDLIKSFEQAADSLKKQPGSVKIDGVNASIRLVNFDDKRQFAMDRGSKKALDLKGVTKADLEDRFGAGHGMIKAGGDVLDIFNTAMNTIQPELERLGLWDNPNIMFNMEYVSGKSNVQDYGKNFLAIHGLLEVETKEVVGKSGKTLTKRVTSEVKYNQSDLDALLKKLEPFAKKKGFEVYGSVPTTFTKDPDFKSALNKRYTIDTSEGDQTKTLAQWLDGVTNIPKTDRLKMNVNGSVKDVGALSKQVYFAVFGGENVDDLFNNEQEIQKAIQGATTYLATEKLGDVILDVLDSPMGSVNDHEGVVIRDEKISNRPFKITGKFITGGVSSQFQQK